MLTIFSVPKGANAPPTAGIRITRRMRQLAVHHIALHRAAQAGLGIDNSLYIARAVVRLFDCAGLSAAACLREADEIIKIYQAHPSDRESASGVH